MKSLADVLAGIEAFKKDMEDLGVDVQVTVIGSLEKEAGKVKHRSMIATLKLEDLEARPCKHGPIPTVGCPKDLEKDHSERIRASLRAEEKAAWDREASG